MMRHRQAGSRGRRHSLQETTLAARTRIAAAVLTGTAAVLAIGLSATSASAATWTVGIAGGPITVASASAITLTDTVTGRAITCASSSGTGTFGPAGGGTGLAGAGIGSITGLTFTTCTGPQNMAFTVTAHLLPWSLNAISYTTPVTDGTITGISLKFFRTGCSAVLDGPGAPAGSLVKATYTNGLSQLQLLAAGAKLQVHSVSGCSGLFHDHNPGTVTGAYTVTPGETLTSP